MFLYCSALAQQENEDITAYFADEMIAVPTSHRIIRHEESIQVWHWQINQEEYEDNMSDYATQLPPDSILVIEDN